jgi:hypothetical protein
MNYLPGLALNHDPPDLRLLSSRITGVSHQCPASYSDLKATPLPVTLILPTNKQMVVI